MAYKVQSTEIKDQFKRFLRYSTRIAPIVVIVGVIAWFFLLRSPNQTNTSGSTGTPDGTPETAASSNTSGAKPEAKVSDNSTLAAATDEEGKGKAENLPETGPADTFTIFAVTAVTGTLFWEWHLRRARQNS